jgi:hypothetical protein
MNNRNKLSRFGFALTLIAALVWSQTAQAVCFVNGAATGSNNGTSWANAYTNLQTALASPSCTVVFVARGTYKPTATTDRTISFRIPPQTLIWGGFDGTEALLGDRKLFANPTILSGDIGAAGDASDNSYHVVVMDGTTASGSILGDTQLSDLTIRDGNANGVGANQGFGGGLFCDGNGAGHACSPNLLNLVFEDNGAVDGGALYNLGSNGGNGGPYVYNSVFRNNTATNNGAAMYNEGKTGTSSPLVDQTAFVGNDAAFSAGAMYNDGAAGVSSPTVRNTTFYGNTANFGGAMINYGYSGGHANPLLRYVTFSRNKARFGPGGAIRNLAVTGDSSPSLSGVILWGDEAASAPVEMETESPTSPTVEYTITPDCPVGAVGCISADPMLGPLQDNGAFQPSLRPGIGSPAIDAGNAVNCPAVDQRGIARPQGAQCDIGAIELRPAETKRCYANRDNPTFPGDGLSWATAYTSPWGAIYAALINANCSEVWVAKGTYVTNNLFNAAAFSIPPGKALYGGFAGTETSLSQRDLAANETILDGQGLWHVVLIDAYGSATNITASTVLDGFTITGGNANSTGLNSAGAGLLNNGAGGYVSNPTLANLVIKNNNAVEGAGMLNNGQAGMSSPSLLNVKFVDNHATIHAGALYNDGDNGVSSPTLTAVEFTGNSASNGGGMFSSAGGGVSSPKVVASRFVGNTATYGGAVQNDGATPSFTDVTFSGNQGTFQAGAVYNNDYNGPVNAQFTSVTFSGNSANIDGGAVYNVFTNAASLASFDHVVFAGNVLTDTGRGGAVSTTGHTVFRDVLFAHNGGAANSGGAISSVVFHGQVIVPNLTIDGASFVGNVAPGGAAVLSSGNDQVGAVAAITNATFWSNFGTSGGAISNSNGSMVLNNVTFGGNSASDGGALKVDVFQGGSADVTISNTIFWGDSASSSAEIEVGAGATTEINHSIVQNGCPVGATCSTISSANPLLGLFQYYGGFTPTLMPAANSPALNAGVSCTPVDQRGVARPQGPACDIGSVERRSLEDYLFNSGFEF